MKFLTLAWKDLKSEFRTKQMLNSMIIFALLIIVIFRKALGEIPPGNLDSLAPAILWITFVFAGILGLSRAFTGEMENGCLEGLKLCPIDRATIFNGKATSTTLLMFIMEPLAIPIFLGIFNYRAASLLGLLLVIPLGTIGFVLVGTLLSALTVNTRTRELLLPIILFPILIPLLLNAVSATQIVLTGRGLAEAESQLKLLVAYDLLFYLTAQILFEYVIED